MEKSTAVRENRVTNKREQFILDSLNVYRQAIRDLYGNDIGEKSQVWYDSGWCYVWLARKFEDGSIGTLGEPMRVRLKQLNQFAQTLKDRISVSQKEENV